MTFEELEAEHSAVENLTLTECTGDQLRVKLAYHMWKDGADWPVVCEMRDKFLVSRGHVIRILEERFGL
jgi:hypothetical protein